MKDHIKAKVEQMARMDIRGFNGTKIAQIMNISPSAFYRIRQTDEYRQLKADLMSRQLGHMDANLQQVADTVGLFEEVIPDAAQVIIDEVRVKKNLRAALEVLDRDPRCRLVKRKHVADPTSVPFGAPGDLLAKAAADAEAERRAIEKHPPLVPDLNIPIQGEGNA